MKIELKHILLWCLSMAAIAVSACDAGGKDEVLPPSVDVNTTTVGAEEYSQFIYVKSSSPWRIIFEAENGETVDWIEAQPNSGNGNANVTLKVSANDSGQARSAILKVTNDAGSKSLTISQEAKKSVGRPDDKPDDKPDSGQNGGNLSAKTDWLELPSVPNGADAFTHSMKIGSAVTRNYSFAWDYNNLVAPWVAYPLCRWNIGSSVKRTEAWALDPLLPESKQPVLYKGFGEGNAGWFARGHQIASADRLTSYESNAMTFYGTNMTPQINSQFNADIWANLESKVRSWANSSDTLYVVTGCVIDYKDGETVKYALDNVGKKVTVPTAYYKAVLRYMKSSTVGYSGYAACAVWMDHKTYSEKAVSSKYSMSVDELEKKTGIDFFVNLPAKVGEDVAAKIEAEEPSKISWWW